MFSSRTSNYGILTLMISLKPEHFRNLYQQFSAPITSLDCGNKCAPYNVQGVPYCCDIQHSVPSIYLEEWDYLRRNTNLWRPWQTADLKKEARIRKSTPDGHLLVQCLGHKECQREFRSITCRAFPFFPYITPERKFIGVTYYREYEDRCWVISNLGAVSESYLHQFFLFFDQLFHASPSEMLSYKYQSTLMRRSFSRHKRAIPIFHRNGNTYKISPLNGRLRKVPIKKMSKFGPYKLAIELPFPDEIS